MPPIRCSNPGVPGIAQGLAKVFLSLEYDKNWPSAKFDSSAKETSKSGRSATFGTCQGSEPFANYPSVN